MALIIRVNDHLIELGRYICDTLIGVEKQENLLFFRGWEEAHDCNL